jgi:hypothetical protein
MLIFGKGIEMRKNFFAGLVLALLIFGLFVPAAYASSISGTLSYGGTTTESIVAAVFTEPLTCSGPNNGEPYTFVELGELGNYTIPALADNTYYVAAVIIYNGLEGDLTPTDPWKIYGCGTTPTPIEISSSTPITGINMTLVDGTLDVPNPYYSKYYIDANSAHDATGYWVEINVDDSSHAASAVSVTGPGITGTAALEYNSTYGNWYYTDNKLAFSASPLSPLPLNYDVAITDSSGTSHQGITIEAYAEQFAANLWPDAGPPADPVVFSWTGVEGDYTYQVSLDSENWHRYGLTETSILYDGPP